MKSLKVSEKLLHVWLVCHVYYCRWRLRKSLNNKRQNSYWCRHFVCDIHPMHCQHICDSNNDLALLMLKSHQYQINIRIWWCYCLDIRYINVYWLIDWFLSFEFWLIDLCMYLFIYLFIDGIKKLFLDWVILGITTECLLQHP